MRTNLGKALAVVVLMALCAGVSRAETVLTFGSPLDRGAMLYSSYPTYGGNVSVSPDPVSGFVYGGAANTPHVTVEYNNVISLDGVAVTPDPERRLGDGFDYGWTTTDDANWGHPGDLVDSIYPAAYLSGTKEIAITLRAQPGFYVVLNSFNAAAYSDITAKFGSRALTYTGTTGAMKWSSDTVALPGYEAGAHLSFAPGVKSGAVTLSLITDDGGGNTAIGNISFSEVPALPGDADGSGLVDQDDYKIWYDNYGTGTTWATGNFKGTGVTDQDDYKTWYDNYGGQAGGAVPEPATLALLAIGGLGLLRRRK